MLSLSACVSNAGSNGPDESIEEIQSESEVTEEETSESAVVETSETSDETTVEPSDETSVASSDESVADPGEVVVAESESNVTAASEPSVDTYASGAKGSISVNLSGKSAQEIADSLLQALRITSNTTAEEYAKQFSGKPEISYSEDTWIFDGHEKKFYLNNGNTEYTSSMFDAQTMAVWSIALDEYFGESSNY